MRKMGRARARPASRGARIDSLPGVRRHRVRRPATSRLLDAAAGAGPAPRDTDRLPGTASKVIRAAGADRGRRNEDRLGRPPAAALAWRAAARLVEAPKRSPGSSARTSPERDHSSALRFHPVERSRGLVGRIVASTGDSALYQIAVRPHADALILATPGGTAR